MPQLVLFILLPFAICHTLTRISEKPIYPLISATFTSSYFWYRSATNETIRLDETSSKSVPVPPKLIDYEITYREANTTGAFIYAPSASATIPFYWTDGDVIHEYDFYSNYTEYNRETIYHVVSNGRNYILSVFSYGKQWVFYESSCVCLETGVINTVTTKVIGLVPVIVYEPTGSFYLLNRYRPEKPVNEFMRYDPYHNKLVILDSYNVDSLRYFHLVYQSIIYPYQVWSYEYGMRRYDLTTNITSNFTTPTIIAMAYSIPMVSYPNHYIVTTTSDLSYVCSGDLPTCKVLPLPATSGMFTLVPSENKYVYIHHHYPTRLLSYSFDTHQGELLYSSLQMKTSDRRSVALFNQLHYHEESNSVWFTGYESFHASMNFNLFKFDMKTRTVTEVTNLCKTECGTIGMFLSQRNGTLFVIKGDEEMHLYKVEMNDTPVPTEEPRVSHVPVIVLLGLLFCVVVMIGSAIVIRRFITKTLRNSEPYESVVH